MVCVVQKPDFWIFGVFFEGNSVAIGYIKTILGGLTKKGSYNALVKILLAYSIEVVNYGK